MNVCSRIMKVHVMIAIAASVSCATATCFGNAPKDRVREMSDSVRVVVQTDKTTYSMGNSMKISAALHNVGDAPIYIDRRMFWTGIGGGLEVEILDAYGTHLPARFLSDAIMPPPEPDDASILIRLDDGFFTVRR